MDETDEHPLRDERRLRVEHALEENEVRAVGLRRLWVVAADRVVREPAQELGPTGHGRVLERADADVARGNTREHGTRQHRLAHDGLSCRDDGERPGGRNPERAHGLSDHVLTQHRADDGLAVAAARHVRAELMAGVGLGDRHRAVGNDVAGQDRHPAIRSERLRVHAQLHSQRLVEREQPRLGHGRTLPRHVQPLELTLEGVVEGEQRPGGDSHGPEARA
jgi:hypothetical protein